MVCHGSYISVNDVNDEADNMKASSDSARVPGKGSAPGGTERVMLSILNNSIIFSVLKL